MEGLDCLRELMNSFLVEVNWIKGTFSARFDTDFQEACYLLLENSSRVKFCARFGCPAPYFIATRTTQRYCEGGCLRHIQKEAKLRWWKRVGDTRRRQQKRRSPSR